MNQDEHESTLRQPLVASTNDEPSVSRSSVASASVSRNPPNWFTLAVALTGMSMETFDFASYAYFAGPIGDNFFPRHDKGSRMILSLVAFGIACVSRPIGALILGQVGDRYGNKTAIEIALLVTGFSTLILSILPTYPEVGPLAPALLFIFRFIQGFGLGGNNVTTMLFAKDHNESDGIAIALAYMSNFIGILLGNLLSVILNRTLSQDQIRKFGWRIPFAIGTLAILCGCYIKFFVKKDPPNSTYDQKTHYQKVFSSKNLKPIFNYIGFGSFGYTAFFLAFIWLPTALKGVLKPPMHDVFIINFSIMLVTIVFFMPFAGMIVDRINHMHLVAFLTATGIIWFPITYSLMIHFHNEIIYGVVTFCCGIWCAISAPAQFLYAEKRFPPEERVTAVSFAMHTCSAIFGGFTPVIAMLLFKVNKYLPSVLVSGTGILSLICLYFAHTSLETYDDEPTELSKPEERVVQEVVEEEIDAGIIPPSTENVV